jgi:putative ABC transport system ATP-binding protein
MTHTEVRATALGVDMEGRALFRGVDLFVASGQMLVVTGASGSGKSTLALVLAGVLEPDHGEVTLNELPLNTITNVVARPALVTQDFGLVSTLTAIESVALPLQVLSLAREEIRDRAALWLGALGIEACANHLVEELSGGQQQRVAIARALAKGSEVIVMDEPTSELDAGNRALLLSILADERARGVTIIVVSHESDVVDDADFVYELSGFVDRNREDEDSGT